jgi:hypothetical protein
MRSSTSDSEIARATCLLAAGCLAVALGVELGARVAFDRVSRIQRRMAGEYELARTIGNDAPCGRQHMLVVGNSLLDEDVRFDDVRDALRAECDARRFIVEQTFYFDWYYGLRRLLRDGARPDVVVVMLSTRQWIRADSRGDYSAQYLMSLADLPDAARQLRLTATQTANLALSNLSKFWGVRAELRNFVLGRLMPDLGRLMDFSSVVDLRPLLDDEVADVARDRIARLKALAAAHGVELVLVLPAVLESKDGSAGFLRAAEEVGVTTIRPLVSGTLGPHLYRDAGFHLNPAGAQAFTPHFIRALRDTLAGAKRARSLTRAASRSSVLSTIP